MNTEPSLDNVQSDAEKCLIRALAEAIFHLSRENKDKPRERELRLMEAELVRMRLESLGFDVQKRLEQRRDTSPSQKAV